MSDHQNAANEEFHEFRKGDLVMLMDEDDKEEEFELLDVITHEGTNYAVLVHEDEDEVVILRMGEEEQGYCDLAAVEDQELLDHLFEVFKERNADQYDFS